MSGEMRSSKDITKVSLMEYRRMVGRLSCAFITEALKHLGGGQMNDGLKRTLMETIMTFLLEGQRSKDVRSKYLK
jgi:hypothetical protein